MHTFKSSRSRVWTFLIAIGWSAWHGGGLLSVHAAAPEPEGYAWRDLNPLVSPSPRVDHAMAHDSWRSVTVMFGGKEVEAINIGYGRQEWSDHNDTALGDTWEFDGRTWLRRAPLHSPPACYGHTMTYDEARHVVVLYGGKGGWRAGHPFNSDVWEWDGQDWTQVETSGESPGPQWNHGMAYDRDRSVHVVFGGNDRDFHRRGDTWEYNGATRTWTLRSQSGPSPRSRMGLAFDAARHRTVMVGGSQDWYGGDDFQSSDTWIWNGVEGTWTQHRGQDVPARQRLGVVYHSGLQAVMAVGGIVEFINYSLAGHPISTAWQPDTWAWDGADWVNWRSADFCCLASPRALIYELGRQQLLLFETLVGLSNEGPPAPPRTAVFSAQGNQPEPLILHVDPARAVDPQDGSFDRPLRTVRQAVDRATPGTIISNAAGEYVEAPITFASPGRIAVSAAGGSVTIR